VYVCDVFGLVWEKSDISLVGAHRFKKFWQIIGFDDEKKGGKETLKEDDILLLFQCSSTFYYLRSVIYYVP
jgi:hypothetical protein